MKGRGMPLLASDASGSKAGLWRAIAGFIIWAVAFVALYVGHATGCLYAPSTFQPATLRLGLVVMWLLMLMIVAVLALRSGVRRYGLRDNRSLDAHACFTWRITFLIDLFALGAVFITGLPLLLIQTCTP